MQRFWTEVAPPMAMVLAGYCGWKPRKPRKQDLAMGEDLVNFLKAMEGG